ncbi:MAG: hypothetical protein JNN08_31825, partial [Bryobacterales bacterium]|nr:hypothetical protein [Bryobacterales bacterium]
MKFAIALLIAALAGAQEPAKPQNARMIRLQHTETGSVVSLVGPIAAKGAVTLAADAKLNIITLSGPPDAVAVIENFIKQIDAARKSIEVTAWVIVGQKEANAEKMPDDLQPVLKQLKSLFPFAGYRLAETAVVRGVAGQGSQTRGSLPNPAPIPQTYTLRYRRADADSTEGIPVIKLSEVRFDTMVPYEAGVGQHQYMEASIISDVSLKSGQKVVLGKTSAGLGKESLFLVLS